VLLSLIVFLEDEKSLSAIVFGAGINHDKTVPVSVPVFWNRCTLQRILVNGFHFDIDALTSQLQILGV
jgi:hypothetical protein